MSRCFAEWFEQAGPRVVADGYQYRGAHPTDDLVFWEAFWQNDALGLITFVAVPEEDIAGMDDSIQLVERLQSEFNALLARQSSPTDEVGPRTQRLREDIGALALSARDEMIAKADERAKRPIPLKHDSADELWAMVEQRRDGSWVAETITPLPMGLPPLKVTGPVKAALEPNLRHQYAWLLERAKIESKRAASERATRAEVRFA